MAQRPSERGEGREGESGRAAASSAVVARRVPGKPSARQAIARRDLRQRAGSRESRRLIW